MRITLEQHRRIAWILDITRETVAQAWLASGDVNGPLRPHGEIADALRALLEELARGFAEDFPRRANPYKRFI